MKTIAAVAPLSKRHGIAAAARLHIGILEELFHVTTYESNVPKLNADVVYVHRSPGPQPPPFIRNRVNVAYWCCESTIAAPEYLPHSQSVNQIWTPSEASRNAILRMDPSADVRVVPHPVSPKSPTDRSGRDTFTILTAGAAPIARKNIPGAFRAFRQAFPLRNYPHVAWIVKLRGMESGQFSDGTSIAEMLSTDPRIRLINADIDKNEMEYLYRESDCYLQLHLFGAFELHCAEAASFELPVICSNVGGPIDYLPAESLVPVKMVPVPNDGMALINRVGEWAEPSIDAAVEKLRRLHDDKLFRTQLGKACYDTACKKLVAANVKRMTRYLIEGLPQIPKPYRGKSITDVVRTGGGMKTLREGLELVGEEPVDGSVIPIVASHRRSGTHHLGEFIRRNWASPWLKTHDFPERLPQNPRLFIVRNPIDCLHSTWCWFRRGGGANNDFIADVMDAYSFNDWLRGSAGREFGFGKWPHKQRDSLAIHRGMFYDPIRFWSDLLLAHFQSGSTIITHERLRKDPNGTAELIAGAVFGSKPLIIDPVSDLVGLGPHGKVLTTPIGAKLSEWSPENLERINDVVSSNVLNVVGYGSLQQWLTP